MGVADSGRLTQAMVQGLTLRSNDVEEEVVSSPEFSTFEAHVTAGDLTEAKKLLVTSTKFGRLLSRALLGFKESVDARVDADDVMRPRLNQAMMAYIRKEIRSDF